MLVESVTDLPDFTKAKQLFLDIESKNNTENILDKKYSGFYPYKGDRIAGFSVTADDCPNAYYIPMRHLKGNLPLDVVQHWLRHHLTSVNEWVNHNVVFDASFVHFENVEFTCKLVCTLTLSKVHDSDRFGHGLKDLCRSWLNMPMEEELEIAAYLKGIKSRDYGKIPMDIIGRYSCMDVHGARALYKYLVKHRDPTLKGIWETEIALASVLYDMEIEGLKIDPRECKIEQHRCLTKMIDLATRIEEITDREWTNSSQCIYDILVNQFGLPVLATIKERVQGGEINTGRPTFDKKALALYDIHPQVLGDPKLQELLTAIISYRQESQHKGLFLDSFLELHDDNNCIHPSYNAVVRTGRMSCSRPNTQQQNKRSKKLIHPREGFGFLSNDYSQIEYRLIAHYIRDIDVITAYISDPTTDFHQWVADLLNVKRDAGKTMNFGMAYGAGKKLVTKNLSSDPSIIKEIGELVNQLVDQGKINETQRNAVFQALCEKRAIEVYHEYHERIPGIKRTAYEAAQVCKKRGFIFNAYGRRRHLPLKASYKAFNSLIQGCAMDIMKERMIALSPRYNKQTRDMGIRLAGNVHDEIFSEVPLEILEDSSTHNFICDLLESPNIEFRVPMKVGLGISRNNWAEAAGDEGKIR